jgi:hypothetical protein
MVEITALFFCLMKTCPLESCELHGMTLDCEQCEAPVYEPYPSLTRRDDSCVQVWPATVTHTCDVSKHEIDFEAGEHIYWEFNAREEDPEKASMMMPGAFRLHKIGVQWPPKPAPSVTVETCCSCNDCDPATDTCTTACCPCEPEGTVMPCAGEECP